MFRFISQYIKNPRYIGAIAPSGKLLARKMTEPISFNRCRCIVEYGPGTGVFTRELVKQRYKGTIIILLEKNQLFYNQLVKEFKNEKNMYIYNTDARNINSVLKKLGLSYADYIISGLPFSSLPESVSVEILSETRKAIGSTGRFITFQYSLFKINFFRRFFKIEKYVYEFFNLPPAYVITMCN